MKSKPRVLLVDDERVIRLIVEETLSRGGYFVFSYSNSDDCKRDVKLGLTWDIAIVDRSLSKGRIDDGDELIRYLHDNDINKPIICMSAYEELESVPGANVLIRKPFRSEELLATIKQWDYLFA